ncbi:BON domain-containing protein [Actinoplanes sp. NPDC049668]|uniref:BON domain-containing protein n=1 Tax=unclassified Actinoplanes TaxID=2626549 RepID=UPI0033A0770E
MIFWWYTDWFNGPAYAGQRRTGHARHDLNPPGPVQTSPGLSRDQGLLIAVAEALLDDPALTGGYIDLSVQNGVVILDGEVDTQATHTAAVAQAWSVAGVADVCDALALRTGEGRQSRN